MLLLCALLRSWEDRLGARGVAFDCAMIHVSVARPPRDADHATHVALEHVLTGADKIYDGTVPYPEYAASLVNSPLWSTWWDDNGRHSKLSCRCVIRQQASSTKAS